MIIFDAPKDEHMRTLKKISIPVIIIILIVGCKSGQYDADISGITAEVKIKRLEKDLFSSDPSTVPAAIPDLKRKYGSLDRKSVV